MRAFLLCLLFINFSNFVYQRDSDVVESKTILVKNKYNKVYDLGSAKHLQAAFGKAAILKEPDEVQGGFGYTYKYSGFETYFHSGNWEETVINGLDFTLILNKQAYKVGDPISKFKAQFPISYKNRRSPYNENLLYIAIKYGKQYVDAGVFIKFDSKGIITEMSVANDNS